MERYISTQENRLTINEPKLKTINCPKELYGESHKQFTTGNNPEHCVFPTPHYPQLRRAGSLSSGSESAFSPVRGNKSDEYRVSSTTDGDAVAIRSRSPSPADIKRRRSRDTDSQISHQKQTITNTDASLRYHQKTTTIGETETATATSTTSSEEDEERLRMQKHGSRGRRGAIGTAEQRPPSCGTPLGKIAEETNSSKKLGLNEYTRKRGDEYKQRKHNNVAFLTPATPNDAVYTVDQQSTPGVEQSRGNFYVQPHIPVDSKIRDGRYPFDPRQLSLPDEPGIGNTLPDISLLPISPHSPLQPSLNGAPGLFMGSGNNSSLDLYMRSLTSPTMSILSQARGLSPRHSIQGREGDALSYYYGNNTTGPSNVPSVNGNVSSVNPMQNGQAQSALNTMAYYQLAQQQSLLAAVANAGVDRSFGMSFDRNGDLSRLSSPFYMRSRQGQKRALSISPSHSDISIDLMIRTSPNSLLPFTGSVGNSRTSSVRSAGSYGHLSARGISPQMGFNTRLASPIHTQLLTSRLAAASSGFSSGSFTGMPATSVPLHHQMARPPAQFHSTHQHQQHSKQILQHPNQAGLARLPDGINKQAEKLQPYDQGIIKTEPHSPAVTSALRMTGANPPRNVEETETVYETKCGWENCTREFDTQEQLVHHINNGHIHGEKKEFVCRWKDCARDQKPFKAQYMLVVHMRRHTGEKPHKCQMDGCTKAYSRLENLKTHMRSHTGEKPYVCEYAGCSKAFSNASDRAKHQNRTHSNEKPYVCRIPNCTKRYTDPSSLRKHVKTVHGPDAHVTKRMKAEREREEAKKMESEDRAVKQEADSDKKDEKDQNSNLAPGQSCNPLSPGSQNGTSDTNGPGSINPRSNQSTCTSGSDMSTTPQNSPHAHQPHNNNDSGVELNTGYGHDHDSDGDIVVDENPMPDSTSGGVGLQSRRRTSLRQNLIPRMVNQKMQSLSIGNAGLPTLGPDALGDYILPTFPNPKTERGLNQTPYSHYPQHGNGDGTNEVSSTTLINPQNPSRPPAKPSPHEKTMPGMSPMHRQTALLAPDRRDSGTSSGHPSRKPSGVSNASRRSSQNAAQVLLNGSYDPISLGSSRKSSGVLGAPGNTGSVSAPMLPSLNPYTIHRLTSKFNEVTGKPPPTPLDRDSYSKSQLGKWLQEDADARSSTQRTGNSHYYTNMTPPMAPPPHHHSSSSFANRRQSEDPTRRFTRTPLPQEVPGNGIRRASDPVKRPSQQHTDGNRHCNVQRYYSLNNMNPLPGIPAADNPMPPHQAGMHGYNNFLSAGNLQGARQRSDSNGSFFSSESGYQSNGSNLALNNTGDYQPTMVNPDNQHFGNNPSRHAVQQGYHSMPASHGVNENILQQNLNADIISGVGGLYSQNSNQAFSSNQSMMNVPPRPYSNQPHPQYTSNGNDNNFSHGSSSSHYHHQVLQNPIHTAFANSDVPMMQHYNPNGQVQHRQFQPHPPPPNQGQQNFVHPSQGPYPGNHSNQYLNNGMTPRPPPSQNSVGNAGVNRMRTSRMRNNNFRMQSSSANNHQTNSMRINYTPDAEIPDTYLEQEFIDCIPALHVSGSFDDTNKNRSSTKMPADSTTGPDGQDTVEPELRKPVTRVDDSFDAMSETNTDVTLPSMSGFSTRLATPTLQKPYNASLQQQEINEQMALAECWDMNPSSNMALNSMSSMLRTLEEEDKFLQMMPH